MEGIPVAEGDGEDSEPMVTHAAARHSASPVLLLSSRASVTMRAFPLMPVLTSPTAEHTLGLLLLL